MTKSIFGAVISALATAVDAVALCRTYEPICLFIGVVTVMTCLGCIADALEKGGAE